MRKLNSDRLDHIVSGILAGSNIHGAVFHVESTDKSLSIISAGGNLEHTSRYFIASINKLIISFIALRLSMQNLFSLDDRLCLYLPKNFLNKLMVIGGKDYSQELTIRHLIAHTSGLPCYLIGKMPDGSKNMRLMQQGVDQSWPIEKVLDVVSKMKPKFVPGTRGKANYSETNFRILGAVLESITGTSVRGLMENVFSELEMHHTHVLNGESLPCAPVFYKRKIVGINEYWKSTQHDVASTAYDQMKFVRAFFGGRYFTAEWINGLKQWNSIFFPFRYGIGIQQFCIPKLLSPFKAVPQCIGHCGSVGSVAFYVPGLDVYITGTVNQSSSPATAFRAMVKIMNEL